MRTQGSGIMMSQSWRARLEVFHVIMLPRASPATGQWMTYYIHMYAPCFQSLHQKKGSSSWLAFINM